MSTATTADGLWGQRHRSFSCQKVENGYTLSLAVPVEKEGMPDKTGARRDYWQWESRTFVAKTEAEVVEMISKYMLTPAEDLRVPLAKEE